MPEAIMFDKDGVIINSMQKIELFLVEASRQYQLDADLPPFKKRYSTTYSTDYLHNTAQN